MSVKKIRVLIAKAGLDGHDRGAKVIARGLRDAGMEVIYSGIRHTPEEIAEIAVEEDVDVVGLSSLSGAHLRLFPEVAQLLKVKKMSHVLVIGGGVIPPQDIQQLKQAGIEEVFTPGASLAELISFIQKNVRRADD